MQDYPLEVADSSRIGEFVDVYESGNLDDETKFALMQLLLFSLDDYLVTPSSESVEEGKSLSWRIEHLLIRDFPLHLHTLDYWRCQTDELDDEALPENERIFPVTPMVRRAWDNVFAPSLTAGLDGSRNNW